ncbi:MAG: META domain-containing protein [Anaerolineales bacterium]|nr:MAG: META domain-containing protein [Anaerolineales bacterium]
MMKRKLIFILTVLVFGVALFFWASLQKSDRNLSPVKSVLDKAFSAPDENSGNPEHDDETVPTPAVLSGTEWILTTMDETILIPDTNITLRFDDSHASGYAGCNNYGASYNRSEQHRLSFPEFSITAMACLTPEGVMAQEKAYTDALGAVAAYQMADDRLDLIDTAGEVRLVYAPKVHYTMNPGDLVGTAWQLVSLKGDRLYGNATITMSILSDTELEGHAACRDYQATYKAQDDTIRFLLLSMLGESCLDNEALMQQESAYIDLFDRMTNIRFSENQLELISVRDEVLVFIPMQKEEE